MDDPAHHAVYTGLVLLMGCITVTLCASLGRRFNNVKTFAVASADASRLLNALTLQLTAEALFALGVVIFAMAEYFEILDTWSWTVTSWIRFMMFSTTTVTTYYLLATMNRIANSRGINKSTD